MSDIIITPTPASTLYYCNNSDCNTPVFAIDSGSISVVVRHHGTKHTTNIPIKKLWQMYYGEYPVVP